MRLPPAEFAHHIHAVLANGDDLGEASVTVAALTEHQLAVACRMLQWWEPPLPDPTAEGDRFLTIVWGDDHTLDPIGWEMAGVTVPQLAALTFELWRAAAMLRDAKENAQHTAAFDREQLQLVRAGADVLDHLPKRGSNGRRH